MKSDLSEIPLFSSKDLIRLGDSIHQNAIDKNQRVLVILSGSRNFCAQTADSLAKARSAINSIWISADRSDSISPEKAVTQLGMEYDVVIFDAYDQFDIDAFGAISGTLRGGGILFLLIPDIKSWSSLKSSRFLRRALSFLHSHEGVYLVNQNEHLPEIKISHADKTNRNDIEYPFRTADQKQVVCAIQQMVVKQNKQPVVLTSDRGRGKTSALGLAAANLIRQGVKNIIVTAPRLSISNPVFQHAQQILTDAIVSRGSLKFNESELKFVAPDALLIDQPEANLLLVDEAAAIPLPMLEKMLKIYPQIVFSTTIHGYEGTGRGFTLKFNKVLNNLSPGWLHYEMITPIRWADNDPVEQWVDRLLCLDAELPDISYIADIDFQQCSVNLIDRDVLIKDEEKLLSLISLLVYAHYRTQPSDFKHMLDDKNVRLYTLECQGVVVAVILINQEGGFDEELASEIYQGVRRPRGHLLPQTLSFHAGCEAAAILNYARIMRIAVHPKLQGKGLGTQLLLDVIQSEKQIVDAIGTSFGATAELVNFWEKSGFHLVRMGFTQDHASGTHSAVMLLPFSEPAENVYTVVRHKFQHSLAVWLSDSLKDLSFEMKHLLESEVKEDVPALSQEDWKDINSFCLTNRGYETCIWSIKKLLHSFPQWFDSLDEIEKKLVSSRIEQGASWSDVVALTGMSGKSEAIRKLRIAIGKIVELYNAKNVDRKIL